MAAGRQKFIQSPYFATGDPETEEMTTLYAPGMLGCLADFDRGSNNVCQYQLVQQAASIAGVVGSVLVWSAKGTYTVTTLVTNINHVAGIGEKIVATAATFIWVVKHGDRSVLVVDSPTGTASAVGEPVVVSSTNGKANVLAVGTAPVAGAYIGNSLGAQDGTTKLVSTQLHITDQF